MKQKKWWIIGTVLGLGVLAAILALTLGGKKPQSWTQIPEPNRNNLNVAEIPGFVPGANAPEQGGTADSRTETGDRRETTAPETAPEGDGKKPEAKPGATEKPEPGKTETAATEARPGATEKPEPGKTETKAPETEPATETTAPGEKEPEGGQTENTEPEETEPEETEPEGTETEGTEPTVYRLSDDCLILTSLGGYSGNYLEDGSDDLVSNVAAILVTNNGDRMLQVADITFQVNETEQATFRITDLPAGATVLALEQNRRPYSDEDDYTYGRVASGYIDPPSLEEERFSLDTSQAGKLTLENLTGETYGKVYVYYKYVQLGGVYLGGITYRVPFENVAPGEAAESLAGHFNPNNSRIMAVVVMPE